MADVGINERLQPSLLDRLTDLNPEKASETREERVIDTRRLREILQRDLSWLLNSGNAECYLDASVFPHAAASVLNFGMREVSGEFSSAERAQLIREAVAEAIRRFEPRISAGTLDVELRSEDSERETIVSFDIRADMWAQPMPMELFLRSQVDITTGELTLERRG